MNGVIELSFSLIYMSFSFSLSIFKGWSSHNSYIIKGDSMTPLGQDMPCKEHQVINTHTKYL